VLKLAFSDGAVGQADLGRHLSFVGVLAPLADPGYFAQVRVDREAGTITWPNGADLDPLVLHALVTGTPVTLRAPAPRG
jgi:hypothetical protein